MDADTEGAKAGIDVDDCGGLVGVVVDVPVAAKLPCWLVLPTDPETRSVSNVEEHSANWVVILVPLPDAGLLLPIRGEGGTELRSGAIVVSCNNTS